MKRTGRLFDTISSFENLLAAYYEAVRGKRYKASSLSFSSQRERNLLDLRQKLSCETWRPGVLREFTIYQPKERIIAAAPFADRIVHHAIVRILEPIFEPRFIYHSYACRVGKGSHAAILHFRNLQKKYGFVMKLDVRKYFPSINHKILEDRLRSVIKCRKTLIITDSIINSYGEDGKGLPIGNLTSQFFANVFLDPLDKFITEKLSFGSAYLRYMDDMVLFSDSKTSLWRARENIVKSLSVLGLRLNDRRTMITPCTRQIEFLGFQNGRFLNRINSGTVKRASTRLSKFYGTLCLAETEGARGLALTQFKQSLAAWHGHCQWAHATSLDEAIGKMGGWLTE